MKTKKRNIGIQVKMNTGPLTRALKQFPEKLKKIIAEAFNKKHRIKMIGGPYDGLIHRENLLVADTLRVPWFNCRNKNTSVLYYLRLIDGKWIYKYGYRRKK